MNTELITTMKSLVILTLLSLCTFLIHIMGSMAEDFCYDTHLTENPGLYPSCQYYAAKGYCQDSNHTVWLQKNCRRSCGFCQIPPGIEHITQPAFVSNLADINMSLYSHVIRTLEVPSTERCLKRCWKLTRRRKLSKNPKCFSVTLKCEGREVTELVS